MESNDINIEIDKNSFFYITKNTGSLIITFTIFRTQKKEKKGKVHEMTKRGVVSRLKTPAF